MKNKISKSMRFFSITGSLVILAACSEPEPTPWVEEQYQKHAADIKKIFGNEVKEGAEKTYVAAKLSTDLPGEDTEPNWKNRYELTLQTTKETKRVGTGEQPVLNFFAKQPEGTRTLYKEVIPKDGSFALGEKSGAEIPVTRFKGTDLDEKFKDGKLRIKADSSLVLTYRVKGIDKMTVRSEADPVPITWEFTLKKKED